MVILNQKGKRTVLPFLFPSLVIGLSGMIAWVSLSSPPTPSDHLSSTETVTVGSKPLQIRLEALGTVQARRKIDLSPREAGRIIKLLVKEGDRVQAGQMIVLLDHGQIEAQIAQYQALEAVAAAELAEKLAGSDRTEIAAAQAQVREAAANIEEAIAHWRQTEDQVKRYQILAEAGAIAKIDLNNALIQQQQAAAATAAMTARYQQQQQKLAQLERGTRKEEIAQARAKFKAAQAQLQFYKTQYQENRLTAPFTGTITRLFAQEGDFVATTTPTNSNNESNTSTAIAELSSGLEIEARIPEASIAKIYPGQSVTVNLLAIPAHPLGAKVRSIAPTAIKQDNITLFRVKIALDTVPPPMKAGMNAQLTFQVGEIAKAIVVPLAAIVTNPDGSTGVWIESIQGRYFQSVSLGETSNEQVRVLKGLNIGEKILLTPPDGETIDGVDQQMF
jgi:HlyD family secretion protein